LSEERRSSAGDHTKPERETGELTVRLLVRNVTGTSSVTHRNDAGVAARRTVVGSTGSGRVGSSPSPLRSLAELITPHPKANWWAAGENHQLWLWGMHSGYDLIAESFA
jgi:hypothetical protein